MKETPLSKNISANVGRAAQDDLEGDPRSELMHLLFAVRDITETLRVYRADRTFRPPTEWLDLSVAKRYTVMLQSASTRIAELIEQGA